jgi:RNA ligase (TIGR02306 family)
LSSLLVNVCEIQHIDEHPNADRLELATVKGWTCVVAKGMYKEGDMVVYAPIGSVLPQELSDALNVTQYLRKGIVRTTNIRGCVSQGLIIPIKFLLGKNVKEALGITKFELEEKPFYQKPENSESRGDHPLFPKYTNIENIKNYPSVLKQEEMVVITEKIHGTNFRCANIGGEIHVGSRRVNLKESEDNLYWKIAKEFSLDKILQPGQQVFGEIFGKGIQKLNYDTEVTLRLFDLMEDGLYVDYRYFMIFCLNNGLPFVPKLYSGPWDKCRLELSSGSSQMAPHIKEGFVVKPLVERDQRGFGRVILKHISEQYLLKDFE